MNPSTHQQIVTMAILHRAHDVARCRWNTISAHFGRRMRGDNAAPMSGQREREPHAPGSTPGPNELFATSTLTIDVADPKAPFASEGAIDRACYMLEQQVRQRMRPRRGSDDDGAAHMVPAAIELADGDCVYPVHLKDAGAPIRIRHQHLTNTTLVRLDFELLLAVQPGTVSAKNVADRLVPMLAMPIAETLVGLPMAQTLVSAGTFMDGDMKTRKVCIVVGIGHGAAEKLQAFGQHLAEMGPHEEGGGDGPQA